MAGKVKPEDFKFQSTLKLYLKGPYNLNTFVAGILLSLRSGRIGHYEEKPLATYDFGRIW
ncbi:MAG TPA: hypothetical protein ENK09_08840 [Nitrospirae bacterium]|nr:hypothetical protein [Nitrospirota bacterium]